IFVEGSGCSRQRLKPAQCSNASSISTASPQSCARREAQRHVGCCRWSLASRPNWRQPRRKTPCCWSFLTAHPPTATLKVRLRVTDEIHIRIAKRRWPTHSESLTEPTYPAPMSRPHIPDYKSGGEAPRSFVFLGFCSLW